MLIKNFKSWILKQIPTTYIYYLLPLYTTTNQGQCEWWRKPKTERCRKPCHCLPLLPSHVLSFTELKNISVPLFCSDAACFGEPSLGWSARRLKGMLMLLKFGPEQMELAAVIFKEPSTLCRSHVTEKKETRWLCALGPAGRVKDHLTLSQRIIHSPQQTLCMSIP